MWPLCLRFPVSCPAPGLFSPQQLASPWVVCYNLPTVPTRCDDARLPLLETRGLNVTWLTFSPREYQAIARLCRSLDPRKNTHKLKRHLVQALAPSLPPLAERIGQLRHCELRLIQNHFQECQRPSEHGLTAEEIRSLTEACGILLCHARFARPLRGLVLSHLRKGHPELGRKVDRLTVAQFETLCEHVKQRVERWA
jgi:hypothetical protein